MVQFKVPLGVSRATAQRLGTNGIVVVLPGTNTLQNAVTVWSGKGVTLQLIGGGVYNEDLTTYPSTVTDLLIQGPSPPGGTTNTAIATIEGNSAVINFTKGVTGNDQTIWTRVGFQNLVITAPTVPRVGGLIWSSSSSFLDVINCTIVDFLGPFVRVFGSNLYSCRNNFIQSTTPPSAMLGGNNISGCGVAYGAVAGPAWSIDDTFDYAGVQGTTAHLYVGAAGGASGFSTDQVYGPWYFVRARFGPSGLFTQDVAADFEAGGGSAGFNEVWFIECTAINMKMAYNTNSGQMHFVKCRQTVTPLYGNTFGQSVSGSPNGDGQQIPGGGCPLVTNLGTGSTSNVSGTIEVIDCDYFQEAISVPPNGPTHAAINMAGIYLQKLKVKGGRWFVNPAYAAPAGVGAGFFRHQIQAAVGAAQWIDHLEYSDIEFGVVAGTNTPTAVNMFGLGSLDTSTATIGRLIGDGVKFTGLTGQTAVTLTAVSSTTTITPGTATDGSYSGTAPTQDCVISVTAGTVSAITLTKPGLAAVTLAAVTGLVVKVHTGESLKITWSGAPTITYQTVPAGSPDPTTAGDGTHALVTDVFALGSAGKAITVGSEELGDINTSAMAASAVTAVRATAGTYTATANAAKVFQNPLTFQGATTTNASPVVNLPDAGTFTVNDDTPTALITATDGGAGTSTVALGGNVTITNKIANYNGSATAGQGVAPIYGAGVLTLSTNSAPASLSVAPATGRYRISGSLNILTGGTLTFKVKVTYHDLGGNAVTDIPVFTQQNSATLLAGGPTANTTGRFYFTMEITAITGTNIVLADNAGTYTAGTYYFTPTIEQIV